MKRTLSSLFLFLMFCFAAYAQNANAPIAYAGTNAIFVYHAFPPASPLYPNKGFTGVVLEREDLATPGKWVTIGDFHTPQTIGELLKNYQFSTQFFPDGKNLKFDFAASWKKFMKYKILDSIANDLVFTPAQMAYGFLMADTTAKVGKTYIYRVSQTGGSATGGVIMSNQVPFPAIVASKKPRVLRRLVELKAIRVEWFAKGGARAFNMKVFRRSDNEKTFTEIKPFTFIELKNDTLKYSIRDEHVAFSTMYHYYITPVNSFGGGGNVKSDTVHATCMEARGLEPPQFFSAVPGDKQKVIKIKFRLQQPDYIGSISVMRSTEYSSGYKQIGVASGYDTTYMDYRITAGQKYYYYLLMHDKMGRAGVRSVKTFGLYQSRVNDFEPDGITVVKQGKNVLIAWRNPLGQAMSGYYVYRCEGVDMPLKRLTVLIAQHDSSGSYVDKFLFKPGVMYGYAVRSENTSNVESANSKIVYIKANEKDSTLIAPKSVEASVQNSAIRLTWYNVSNINASQTASRIYRKANTDKDYLMLEDNYPVGKSSYLDTSVKGGVNYVYAVESTGGLSSNVKGVSNVISLPVKPYPAPAGLTGYVTSAGISLTWGRVIDKRVKQFAVYRYTRGSKKLLVATVPVGETNYLDKQAEKGTTYYFFICAIGTDKTDITGSSNEIYVNY